MFGSKSTNGTWIKESNFPVSDTAKEGESVVKQDAENQGTWQGGKLPVSLRKGWGLRS